MPRPVVQGIKLLALDDAAQRVYGAAFADDLSPVVAHPWPGDEPNKAVAFGICHAIVADLTQVSHMEVKYGTDTPPLRTRFVVPFGYPKTFVDFARSCRSMVQDTPWVCLESQWLKMADFAENTQPIDIDTRILLSASMSEHKAPAIAALEAKQTSRRTSKLSAVIQRSSAEDEVLEIYAEPVDNDTLEFLRRS